jgi:Protein of unknown function (DUF4238)
VSVSGTYNWGLPGVGEKRPRERSIVAEKTKQHFVPQFYMRNFSLDVERKTIALYVIDADKHVPTAAIKDQAYKNNMYGRTGVEDRLSRLEGKVSPLIQAAIHKDVLPKLGSDDHHSLLTFVLFQHARTPQQAAGMNELQGKLVRAIARDFTDLKDEADGITVNDRDAPVMALRMVSELLNFATDLRWRLVENKTPRLFITSDNPAVYYNQFLEKRKPLGSNTGLQSRGLQIFLPLGPRHLLMLYDGDVYRVGGRKHLEVHVKITQESSVEALNAVQAANAAEVLYFSEDTSETHVREAIGKARAHRRAELTEFKKRPGMGPNGEMGELFMGSDVELRMGLDLDFVCVLSSAAGPPLKPGEVHLRKPELVHRFEEARLPRP